jgi:DNA-binding beta-propeller fold protein YncE
MRIVAIILPVFIFCGCVKDKPAVSAPQVTLSNEKKVFVLNEGNFGSGNGSVSMLDPGTDEVVEDVFKSQNNTPLGDVVQSMAEINGMYYIVVNNSGKIAICDRHFKKTGEIKGLSSPRYIIGITPQKAYVTDLHANGLHIVDLNTNSKTGSIACAGWTEHLAMIYNKVFVTNVKSKFVYVINTISDKIEDSLEVGLNASGMLVDNHSKIWVLRSGDESKKIKAAMTRIDPVTHKIESVFALKNYSAFGLCGNSRWDTLYFLSGGIVRFGTNDDPSNGSVLVPAGSSNFYGLGISPSGEIYVSDALDYTQRSAIYVYNGAGNRKKTYKAGIISNGFYFE